MHFLHFCFCGLWRSLGGRQVKYSEGGFAHYIFISPEIQRSWWVESFIIWGVQHFTAADDDAVVVVDGDDNGNGDNGDANGDDGDDDGDDDINVDDDDEVER